MKTILITGITKGIGKAIAARFADAGYHIIGCASTATSIEALLSEAPLYDLYKVDVANKEQLEHFAHQVVQRYGYLDVVVNNAGIFVAGGLQTAPTGLLESLLATNLTSAYYLTKALLPTMIAQGQGSIVNVCSTASITAYPDGLAYGITKFGLLGFSRGLREELKTSGVRVISVLPGATYTDSWAGSTVPPARMMAAEDVAEVVYLACTLPQGTVLEEIVLRPQLGDLD